MRCLARALLGFLSLFAAFLRPLPLSSGPQADSLYGPLPVFELHSGFWLNLHHSLYQEARQQRGAPPVSTTAKAGKSAKPTLHTAPAVKTPLTAAEQRVWVQVIGDNLRTSQADPDQTTERDPDAGVKWTNTVKRTAFLCRFRNYASTIAVVWPRIFTVWFNCSILSGFFKTVTGLICKILSSISLSG